MTQNTNNQVEIPKQQENKGPGNPARVALSTIRGAEMSRVHYLATRAIKGNAEIGALGQHYVGVVVASRAESGNPKYQQKDGDRQSMIFDALPGSVIYQFPEDPVSPTGELKPPNQINTNEHRVRCGIAFDLTSPSKSYGKIVHIDGLGPPVPGDVIYVRFSGSQEGYNTGEKQAVNPEECAIKRTVESVAYLAPMFHQAGMISQGEYEDWMNAELPSTTTHINTLQGQSVKVDPNINLATFESWYNQIFDTARVPVNSLDANSYETIGYSPATNASQFSVQHLVPAPIAPSVPAIETRGAAAIEQAGQTQAVPPPEEIVEAEVIQDAPKNIGGIEDPLIERVEPNGAVPQPIVNNEVPKVQVQTSAQEEYKVPQVKI